MGFPKNREPTTGKDCAPQRHAANALSLRREAANFGVSFARPADASYLHCRLAFLVKRLHKGMQFVK